jgi:hypothetical protein
MTVIAWDGKTLAADRRSTTSWGAHDVVTKIERHDGSLLALTGKPAYALRLREWYKAGAIVSDFPPQCAAADEGNLVVITPQGLALLYSTGPYPERWENPFCAWGGGRDFAIAAMHCGKTAVEAVQITCVYSVHCGNGINTLELNP